MPSAVTLVVLVISAVAVEHLSPRGDFRPFVMTIEEWKSERGHANGTTKGGTYTYHLDYRSRDNWTLTLVGDDQIVGPPDIGGARCDRGTYETFDARGHVTGQSRDPGMCNGVLRWIHYGLAEHWIWPRVVVNGQAIYTSEGERVVFDLRTGLPVLYEAGLSRGFVGARMVFRVERYGR